MFPDIICTLVAIKISQLPVKRKKAIKTEYV